MNSVVLNGLQHKKYKWDLSWIRLFWTVFNTKNTSVFLCNNRKIKRNIGPIKKMSSTLLLWNYVLCLTEFLFFFHFMNTRLLYTLTFARHVLHIKLLNNQEHLIVVLLPIKWRFINAQVLISHPNSSIQFLYSKVSLRYVVIRLCSKNLAKKSKKNMEYLTNLSMTNFVSY